MAGVGALWATRVMEIVKKHDSGGLVWKRIRVGQNEAVLKSYGEQPPPSNKFLEQVVSSNFS